MTRLTFPVATSKNPETLKLLGLHPLIVGSAGGERRELVIGRGSRGCVALYGDDPLDDAGLVLALRAQHEAGLEGV